MGFRVKDLGFRIQGLGFSVQGFMENEQPPAVSCLGKDGWGDHKRPYVGVSQGTVLGFGDGFGAILWETVAKS